jgi:metallo-beta-lactamase family protein
MKIKFCGGAGGVTGSNYLLESKGAKTLIDCGLYQGGSEIERLNSEPFPYNPEEIDAIFLTHAHLDHIGRLPVLFKKGFRGRIISTPPTKDLGREILLDAGHLFSERAEKERAPVLFDDKDIEKTMSVWETAKYREKITIKDIEVEFHDAGHILGSAFIVLTVDGEQVVFSGDLGNTPAPLVKNIEPLGEADYLVMESTYGGRRHEDAKNRKDLLEDIIENTALSGGVLMIPAFAMERTQALLSEINDLVLAGRIPEMPVFVDSPLAINLTAVYEKYLADPDYFDAETVKASKEGKEFFKLAGLKFTPTTEESKAINAVPAPKVIIAGSGMSQGGRIIHHERRYLSDPKSAILFIGFQTTGSRGRRILEGAKEVEIFHERIPVRCRVESIAGYSAHADQAGLLKWIMPARRSLRRVFLVHGEEDESKALARKARDELAVETEIPIFGEEVVL